MSPFQDVIVSVSVVPLFQKFQKQLFKLRLAAELIQIRREFPAVKAVNHDVVVLLDHKLDDIGKNLLALPVRIAYSVVLVHLHYQQAGGGIIQPLVGGNQVNTAVRMQDTPGQMEFQVLRGVDGGQKQLCQSVLLLPVCQDGFAGSEAARYAVGVTLYCLLNSFAK